MNGLMLAMGYGICEDDLRALFETVSVSTAKTGALKIEAGMPGGQIDSKSQ